MRAIYKQIENYLTYCEKVRKMSQVTIKTKRYILERFAKETNLKNLKQLSNAIFDQYVAKLTQNGASGCSVNTYGASIIAFAKYYQELGLAIPFKSVLVQKLRERRTERTFYLAEEIERASQFADPEIKLIIQIMFETGMRIAEVTKLRISDFEGQRICFIGKENKAREVYVRMETLAEIEKYIQENDIRDFLWGNTFNGEPPTTHTIRKKLKRAFLAAGFPDFYPHALRHSFATNLQFKGASVAEIKEMMGHSSIATTEKYLHGFSGKMRELFEKYN